MLRALRPRAVRLCLPIVGVVLWSMTVLAPAASADRSWAVSSSYSYGMVSSLPGVGVSVPAAGPVSKRRAVVGFEPKRSSMKS